MCGLIFQRGDNLQCKYKYCPNNNSVEKENAIKIGNSYYCKDCYEEKTDKQNIEKYYLDNMPQTTLPLLRKVINQLVHTNKYNPKYILFILEKIHNSQLKINNPFGLVNYCNNLYNLDEWKKQEIKHKYKEIKNQINSNDNNESDTKFEYKFTNKKWTDLI